MVALIREDPGRAQRVELDVRVDPAVPAFAFDADQLTQVLWNIALNARRGPGERGRIGIDVSLRASSMAIAVSDTGRGMSPRSAAASSIPSTRGSRPAPGSASTLARRVVTAHDGQIEVESTPGRGTCFTILLPLA